MRTWGRFTDVQIKSMNCLALPCDFIPATAMNRMFIKKELFTEGRENGILYKSGVNEERWKYVPSHAEQGEPLRLA